MKYLEGYIFKLNSKIYNYEDILYLYNSDKKENGKYLEKIYLTDNIYEAINSRINYYFPKRSSNNADFIEALNKFLINHSFKEKDIIRNDYVTRSLIYIINEKDLNKKLKWLKYTDFLETLKFIIIKSENFEDNIQCDNFIKILKVLEEENKNFDFIYYEEVHNENKKENEDILEYNSEDMILENSILYEDDNNISLLINKLSLKDNNNSIETKSNVNKDKDGILNNE